MTTKIDAVAKKQRKKGNAHENYIAGNEP